jgi:type II secretory pathway component PulF
VKQLTSQRLSQFARQLAFLFGAGLPIDQSIDLLKASFRYESDLQRSLARLARAMQQGKALHTAMAAQRGFYPDLFIQLVRAGEHSGALATSLDRAADFYADQAAFNRRLMQALTYPLLTILIALIIVLFMLLIIIPAFADIYATLDAEIPVYTRLLIDLSHWLQTSGHWFFAGLVAILLLLYTQRRFIARHVFRLALRLPLLGPFLRMFFQARFAYSMHVLLGNAIALTDALPVVRQLSTLPQYRREVDYLLQMARRGDFLAAFQRRGLIFGPLLTAMLRTGEATAQLDVAFKQLADYFGQQLEYQTATLLALLEPLIIVIIGAIVGLIVISMYIPMFEISSGFGG